VTASSAAPIVTPRAPKRSSNFQTRKFSLAKFIVANRLIGLK
jgi:hypothetical protein